MVSTRPVPTIDGVEWRACVLSYGDDSKVISCTDYYSGSDRGDPATVVKAFGEYVSKNPDEEFFIRVAPRKTSKPDLDTELDHLVTALEGLGLPVERGHLFFPGTPGQDTGTVFLDLNLFAMPGEHGFRFFPSFYRHIFDTLKRIPLMEMSAFGPSYSPSFARDPSNKTVYDNLVPSDTVIYVGKGDRPSVRVPRQKASLADAQNIVREMLATVGYTADDLELITRAFLKYMTSSRRRRETEYERISWYEFVDGDRMSPTGQMLQQTSPGTLGGLLGSQSDARTQGTVAVQFVPDNLGSGETSDMLLVAPTDLAWFAHWYRYLFTQGVSFYRGRLEDFEVVGRDVRPDVTDLGNVLTGQPSAPNGSPKRLIFKPATDGIKKTRYVLALPLAEAVEKASSLLQAMRGTEMASDLRDLEALHEFAPRDLGPQLLEQYPTGPIRHLTGIQYFFAQDVRLWAGHTQYMFAPAGLTGIAQAQFWRNPTDLASGYRTILSLDVANLGPPKIDDQVVPGFTENPEAYGWRKRSGSKSRRRIAATSPWHGPVSRNRTHFTSTKTCSLATTASRATRRPSSCARPAATASARGPTAGPTTRPAGRPRSTTLSRGINTSSPACTCRRIRASLRWRLPASRLGTR
jgi:hypothetical protein